MTDTTIVPATDEPPADAPAPAKISSSGQVLLARYKKQFDRLMAIHRRLVAVNGAIVAAPKPAAPHSEPVEGTSRTVSFFGALTMIADASDTVIAAVEQDLEKIAKLFE